MNQCVIWSDTPNIKF